MSASAVEPLGAIEVGVARPSTPPPLPYQRTRRALGDPTPLACTIAKTALEVLSGGRGLDSIVRWVTPRIRESLATQAGLARRAGKRLTTGVTIRRVRVCRVSDRVAEVSVVAFDGERGRAIALKFEDVGGRWQATVLGVG